MNRLSISAVLPHLRVFGGIRRYLSLGQVWASWGHEVVLYTPDGEPAAWLPFSGTVRSFREIGDRRHDVALTPQPALLGALARVPTTRRVWYCAAENEPGEDLALDEPGLLLAAVSTALARRLARRTRRPVIDGAGAVDATFFRPDRGARDPARKVVAAYGRRGRRARCPCAAASAIPGSSSSSSTTSARATKRIRATASPRASPPAT